MQPLPQDKIILLWKLLQLIYLMEEELTMSIMLINSMMELYGFQVPLLSNKQLMIQRPSEKILVKVRIGLQNYNKISVLLIFLLNYN